MPKQVTCPRCSGSGVLPEHTHVRAGVCFKCSGSGTVAAPRTPSPKTLAARANREAERAAYAAERARKIAAAEARYAGDPRLRVDPAHPYYFAHCYELACLDGEWESL